MPTLPPIDKLDLRRWSGGVPGRAGGHCPPVSYTHLDVYKRQIFWINIPVALAALVLGARVLPESRAARRARLDVAGVFLSTVGVLLVLLPLVQGRDWGWPLVGLGSARCRGGHAGGLRGL